MSNNYYLTPTYFINYEHLDVQLFIKKYSNPDLSIKEQVVAYYFAVRDLFRYDAYDLNLEPLSFRASTMVNKIEKKGNCIEKSILFAACTRFIGVPTRLSFSNVCNHIGTQQLEAYLGTNVLVFHGFVELLLEGRWVKATPAFNKELCDKLNVSPLDFDGETDSIFQEYDKQGGQFMEYLHDYGVFHDFPFDMFVRELKQYYPKLFVIGSGLLFKK